MKKSLGAITLAKVLITRCTPLPLMQNLRNMATLEGSGRDWILQISIHGLAKMPPMAFCGRSSMPIVGLSFFSLLFGETSTTWRS
jgi:hypothetical protein